MASEKILNQKKEEVSKLAEEMKAAKLILLVDYRGINVTDVTNLRTELRNINSKYAVIKNNITRRALAECGIEGLDEQLEGPTAVIMNNEDYLESAKVIYNFTKWCYDEINISQLHFSIQAVENHCPISEQLAVNH